MSTRRSLDKDLKVSEILGKINSLISQGKKVRWRNIHCVGDEYIIGNCALEAVMSNWRAWYENTVYDDSTSPTGKRVHRERISLTETQYKQIKDMLHKQWVEDGEIVEERSVY